MSDATRFALEIAGMVGGLLFAAIGAHSSQIGRKDWLIATSLSVCCFAASIYASAFA